MTLSQVGPFLPLAIFGVFLICLFLRQRKTITLKQGQKTVTASIIEPFGAVQKAVERYARSRGEYPAEWKDYCDVIQTNRWSR